MASISFKELCSQNAVQFFKNDMPAGKVWKRKDNQSTTEFYFLKLASDHVFCFISNCCFRLFDFCCVISSPFLVLIDFNESHEVIIFSFAALQKPQHNDYIEKALEVLLKPIISASVDLGDPDKMQVLIIALNELCMAWMNNILDKRIKFRSDGWTL